MIVRLSLFVETIFCGLLLAGDFKLLLFCLRDDELSPRNFIIVIKQAQTKKMVFLGVWLHNAARMKVTS